MMENIIIFYHTQWVFVQINLTCGKSGKACRKIQQIPEAEKQISQRYEATQQIQRLIESAAGQPLQAIIE